MEGRAVDRFVGEPLDPDADVGGTGGQRTGAGDDQEASEKDGQETTGHV